MLVVRVKSVEDWRAERTCYGCCPVSVHGLLESWEVGVHACRDPPGFQHTLAVNLGWAHVVRPRESWAYVYNMGVCGDILTQSVPYLGDCLSFPPLGGD